MSEISPGSPTPNESGPPTGQINDFLDLNADSMRAALTIKGSIVLARQVLTRDDVARKLASLKVVQGVDWEAIDKMIAAKVYDKAQIIANGKMARQSRDASIQEKVKVDPDVKPVMGKDGKADYKNVDNIHQVKKGDVIAVKIPIELGEPGYDIFGKPLPIVPGVDIQFKVGQNTEISSDGLQLIATTGGYLYHLNDAIHVGVIFIHKGDVDFNSGNLHYQGDIQVMGNIMTGFTVEAEGSILIEGTVDSGEVISHQGSVIIKSSIFGHGKGRIEAKKDISIFAAQDMDFKCENGTLTVEKGLRNCMVLANEVQASKSGCTVIGGEIKAFGQVTIGALGGEGCHTTIRFLDKVAEAAKERLKQIEKLQANLQPKLDPVETRLRGMKAMTAKFGGAISDRSKAEMKAVLDQYMGLKSIEKELLTKKEKLVTVMKAAPNYTGKFSVTEKIVWGGILEMYGHLRDLTEADINQEWSWGAEGMTSKPIVAAVDPAQVAKPGAAPAKPG
jgi:uncharacterized protein